MASNVDELILEAASKGSIAELNDIRSHYNWIAIPTHFIVMSCSQQGNTPLQVAVNNGHYDVVEYLIGELKYQVYPKWKETMKSACSFSWSSFDFNKLLLSFKVLSPEMEIIRDISQQVPIVKLIEYLIDPVNQEPFQWLEFLLNSFVASAISQLDKIVALELMGSALIFKHERYVWRGLQCWEQAMALRKSTANGNLPIPNVPYVQSVVARKAFDDRLKVITTELSLQKFKEEWQRQYRYIDVKVQALLVSERILSQVNSGPNSFHLENLIRYGNCCFYEENEYDRAFNVTLLIMEQLNGFQSTSSPNCIRIFARALSLMINCLEQLANSKEKREPSVANFLIVIRFGLTILNKLLLLSAVTQTAVDYWQLNIMEIVYCLLLDHHTLPYSQQQIQQLKNYLANYFYTNNAHSFTSLLHFAIRKIDVIQESPVKVLPVIQLFLQTGADPTATDSDGKTPFHVLAENYDWFRFDLKSYETVFQALLDAGGHLDQATPDGKTFMTILREQKIKYLSSLNHHPNVKLETNTVLPLSCMCAQVIRRAKIPFEHRLPSRMQLFVGRHSALKAVSSLGDSLPC